jgi:hypothetical protein
MMPLLVDSFQDAREPVPDRQHLINWNRSLRDAICRRRTFDRFHNSPGHRPILQPRLYARWWMVQRRDRLSSAGDFCT